MNAKTSIEMVREFHDLFGVRVETVPCVTNQKVNLLRLKLLTEEMCELTLALDLGDEVEVLDALTDLQYVLDGAYLALGFAELKDAAFAEVHRSNLSKLGADGLPVMRPDGKITKGPNYSPPDFSGLFQIRQP